MQASKPRLWQPRSRKGSTPDATVRQQYAEIRKVQAALWLYMLHFPIIIIVLFLASGEYSLEALYLQVELLPFFALNHVQIGLIVGPIILAILLHAHYRRRVPFRLSNLIWGLLIVFVLVDLNLMPLLL